jgi:hypothetical protein
MWAGTICHVVRCCSYMWQAPQWFGPSIATASKAHVFLVVCQKHGAWVTTQPAVGYGVQHAGDDMHCPQGQQHTWRAFALEVPPSPHVSNADLLQFACLTPDTPSASKRFSNKPYAVLTTNYICMP